jgi:hypothetical protein
LVSSLTLFSFRLRFHLRVYRQPRSEVISQNHAHVDPSEGVSLDYHFPCPERLRHIVAPGWIAPAHDDLGGVGDRVRVAEEHYVEPLAAEHPGGGAGRALPTGPIQDFHHHPALRCRDCECVGRVHLPLGGAKQKTDSAAQEDEHAD